MSNRLPTPLLFAAAVAVLAGVGAAAPAAAAAGPAAVDGRGERGPGRHGDGAAHMASHLRDVLQLTPAQEPALQTFLAAMHPPRPGFDRPDGGPRGEHGAPPADPAARRAEMDRRRGDWEKMRAEEASLTTPQRLDRMVKAMSERMARRQADMQAHVVAVKQFYAALTPSQQKAFDALHGGMGAGMRRGMGEGMDHDRRGGRMGRMEGPPPVSPLAMGPPLPPQPPLSQD